MNGRWKVVPRFSVAARSLRSEFDSIFSDERAVDRRRFRFEPWSVPGQYYQLRTPAYEFFDSKNYLKFHHELVDYGRQVLGCHDVSPPWLSLYLDGHFQELHQDAPHGPWAFVYSLTAGDFFKKSQGGFTEIFDPRSIAFSSSAAQAASGKFLERDHVFDSIPPRFNQLAVFDGRFPHRVTQVKNVFHPCDARVVIHGWFVNPRPFVSGPLSINLVAARLDQFHDWMSAEGIGPSQPGVFNFKLGVSAQGGLKRLDFQGTTLSSDDQKQMKKAVKHFWSKVVWKKYAKASEIVIPLSWD